ncbi:NACHT, LRR and PYD domains-containing protein 1-like [Acanthaster planci]|uniref:NACHT, LRR and PYD domains-containing protein 1-like n=1 Tax=Acanthaster planci TaxID=133434 RepID=A0A8B7ZW46_ACAPL|nr:NACHT, LRR and PYD domains-containing protein 1-like [Acanthaster planci]
MIANIVIQSPPSPRPVSAGTTTSWDQEVVASTTEVPYELPVVGIALGSSFGGLTGLVIVVWLLLFVVQKRRNSGRPGRDSEEGTPLSDYFTVEGCQNILKPLFQAKMQNISIDPSEENQGDAMSTEEIFIDLELHEKNHSVAIKSREQMIGLLGGQKRRRHFVVKGAAGCGKTTLVRRFGYDWANGADYMQKFELVFVLKMKEMIEESGLLSAILRQNFPSDQMVSKKALGSVIRKVGHKVLIILDGLDEINLKVLNQRAPPGDISVRDILAVKSLASCCIIVTTRPHMMKKLNSWNEDPVFAVIETTGFSQQNRNKYITHRFSKDNAKAAGLIRQIETAAFLEILAKIPIMLRLLCYIWDNSRQDEVLPARITELYGRVTDALLRHWERKYNTSRESKGEGWEEKVFGALGKVAFAGLMDSSGERLVFPHGEFPGTSLNDGLELGFFLERPGSNEATATFIHKTFQEYFAAYFLVRQTESFIQQELLSKVTIDTVQEVEYVLRFACGMNTQVASVIFQHVRSIKDELISDRYLWVQHLTLMLYYESQSDSLEAGVGSRLSLKYKEEFAALQYYVDKIPLPQDLESLGGAYVCRLPKVHLKRLEVYLHVIKDQSQVKSILQRVDVDHLYFGLLVSDTLGKEFNQLSITVSDLIHKPARTIVCINQKEQGGSDGAAAEPQDQGTRAVEVLVPFCKTKSYGFGLRIECDIIRSEKVLLDIASSLAESQAVYFGVLNNRLNGYMNSLKPLIRFLEYLELYDCDLGEEDLMSLAAMMPRAERLRELYISGGSFSTHAVRVVAHSLTHCSRILMLELRRTGMTPKNVERVVKEIFPEMELVQGNIDCQFWLQGHPSG